MKILEKYWKKPSEIESSRFNLNGLSVIENLVPGALIPQDFDKAINSGEIHWRIAESCYFP